MRKGKCIIKTIRLKMIMVVVAIIIGSVSTLAIYSGVKASMVDSKYIYTVVVDAGHGGRDVGCSGIDSNVNESDINLSIARLLKTHLENQGFRVIMTRDTVDGLYDSDATNFKLSDMNKRVGIVKKYTPDMVISIHQNSFSDRALKGAQVFYQDGDIESMKLAQSIQEQLASTMPYTRGNHNHSDLYLLKESSTLGVLVECGYLTNSEDEANLQKYEYQNMLAYTIKCGVVRYLSTVGAVPYIY